MDNVLIIVLITYFVVSTVKLIFDIKKYKKRQKNISRRKMQMYTIPRLSNSEWLKSIHIEGQAEAIVDMVYSITGEPVEYELVLNALRKEHKIENRHTRDRQ